jgi:hypothetical protein
MLVVAISYAIALVCAVRVSLFICSVFQIAPEMRAEVVLELQ